jgi:hypothetical protein
LNDAQAGARTDRTGNTYRRIRIASAFGKATVLVTDGHLPYPYGHETTGYEVSDLAATLAKAEADKTEQGCSCMREQPCLAPAIVRQTSLAPVIP